MMVPKALTVILGLLLLTSAAAVSQPRERQYARFIYRSQDLTTSRRSLNERLASAVSTCNEEKPFYRSYAILIGVSSYQYLTRLTSPASDVSKLKEFLLTRGGFDEVVVLRDQDATFDAIKYFMEDYFPDVLDERTPSRFIFYFSGHGITRNVGRGRKRGYLQLASSQQNVWSSSIGMDLVDTWADNVSKARHSLFLIDTCVSGLAGVEVKGRFNTAQDVCDLAEKGGSYLITAGQEDEEAIGGARWNGSLFTDAVLTGIVEGSGDSNRDGVITTLELFSYVRGAVTNESRGKQNPGIHALGYPNSQGGELFFLRPFPERLAPISPQPKRVEQKGPDLNIDLSGTTDLNLINQELRRTGCRFDVYFEEDSFSLSDNARATLAVCADLLKDKPQFLITIEGHAAAAGENEYNLAMGDRRANVVKDFLASKGINTDRVRTLSYGEERPVCVENTPQCDSANQRAHLVITGVRLLQK